MSVLLDVADLHVHFTLRRGLFGQEKVIVRAVNGVSFMLQPGETLGIVGESGSGKSTLGRALLRLVPATSGNMRLDGREITKLRGRMLEFRRDVQVVFQDPYSSLNPAMVVADIIGEPLTLHHGMRGAARDARVGDLLEQVGLGRHQLERYPSEFSGGQRQRLAIARALASEPRVIVCDEAVSALDVSTQSQVINLLEDLQAQTRVAYLFIAHDLAVVRHISHRTGVMYLGRMMELGPTERLFEAPAHPYTRKLLDAVPVLDPAVQKRRKAARRNLPVVELPTPTRLPAGCVFHTRCPHVMDVCRHEVPEPVPVQGGGWVACHLQSSGPKLAGRPLDALG
ncbi:MAG: ABC transporter ATP-binding protein [Pseudomonadales bacterium]|nr:ABC transporter ATP-binding protein [Pseudomonadales bacterium]